MKPNTNNMWESWGRTNALYTEWCSERSINPYQHFVLYAINGHEPTTQKKIADYTGLSKQTVGTVMRSLKKEGLVTLSEGDEDRREKYVRLTEKGACYVRKTLGPLYELEGRVFDILGKERMKQMMDAISLFNTVFEKEMEDTHDELK